MRKTERIKNKKERWLVPGLTVVIIVLVFALGFLLGRAGFNVAWEEGEIKYTLTGKFYPDEQEINFDLFWEVWDMLKNRYVEESIDEGDMFYGAIKGMVSALDDPATRFLTSDETDEYESERAGKLEGIGIEMHYMNNAVLIKRALEGSPAEESGLLAGDIIRKVDDEDITEDNISEVATKIRGEKGTKVKITVYRSGEDKELDFEIIRDEIYVESISWEILEDRIVLVSIGRFTEDSYTEFTFLWDEVVDEVNAANPSKIIVDLRGNGGGFLDGAVYVAGEFLQQGSVVLYIQDREGNEETKKVDRDGQWDNIPVVLLVDSATASSSEIFAGALQYYKRAQIIGEDTYGKGSAQDVVKPSSWGGASIHLTAQKWLLPDKRWISHDDPIHPDVEVDISIDQIKNGDDPQLDKALELIKTD